MAISIVIVNFSKIWNHIWYSTNGSMCLSSLALHSANIWSRRYRVILAAYTYKQWRDSTSENFSMIRSGWNVRMSSNIHIFVICKIVWWNVPQASFFRFVSHLSFNFYLQQSFVNITKYVVHQRHDCWQHWMRQHNILFHSAVHHWKPY